MILLSDLPSIVLDHVGYYPADIPAGPPASPLAVDFTLPADAGVEFAWWLTLPLVASGLTLTSDPGAYNLIGAANGVHVQGKAVLFFPPAAAPYIGTSTITTAGGSQLGDMSRRRLAWQVERRRLLWS